MAVFHIEEVVEEGIGCKRLDEVYLSFFEMKLSIAFLIVCFKSPSCISRKPLLQLVNRYSIRYVLYEPCAPTGDHYFIWP